MTRKQFSCKVCRRSVTGETPIQHQGCGESVVEDVAKTQGCCKPIEPKLAIIQQGPPRIFFLWFQYMWNTIGECTSSTVFFKYLECTFRYCLECGLHPLRLQFKITMGYRLECRLEYGLEYDSEYNFKCSSNAPQQFQQFPAVLLQGGLKLCETVGPGSIKQVLTSYSNCVEIVLRSYFFWGEYSFPRKIRFEYELYTILVFKSK